jgi:hypothetical protein
MAAPNLVTLIFDAMVAIDPDNAKAALARKLAEQLEHKVVVIDPDELHVMDIRPDGTWTMAHPLACKPQLFGCLFTTLAEKGFEAPRPGRFRVVMNEELTSLQVVL